MADLRIEDAALTAAQADIPDGGQSPGPVVRTLQGPGHRGGRRRPAGRETAGRAGAARGGARHRRAGPGRAGRSRGDDQCRLHAGRSAAEPSGRGSAVERLRPVPAGPGVRSGARRRRPDQEPGPAALPGRPGSTAGPRARRTAQPEPLAGAGRRRAAGLSRPRSRPPCATPPAPRRRCRQRHHRGRTSSAGSRPKPTRSNARRPLRPRSSRRCRPSRRRCRRARAVLTADVQAASATVTGIHGQAQELHQRYLAAAGKTAAGRRRALGPVGQHRAGPDGPGGGPGAAGHRGGRSLGERAGEDRRSAFRVGEGSRANRLMRSLRC